MPRPRRTRAAPTRPAPKPASPSPVPAPATAQPAETAENSSDIYDVSDREKYEAEATRKSSRNANPTRTMSRSSMNSQQSKALGSARQRRDLAMDRLGNITSTTNTGAEDSNDKSDASIEVGRRATATPLKGRLTDLSGLDLDDDMFDDLNTTMDTAGPASALRSGETSTLSATLFKRRPRAGSFLSRDDGPIRPSSRTGPNTPLLSSTFNIGVFKRRAREPSILGTAQKPRPERPEPEREGDEEEEEEEEEEEAEEVEREDVEEDEFAPEAESTPLRRSKRHSGVAEAVEASPETSSSANPRKRKSAEGHERRVRSSPYEARQSIEDGMEKPASEASSSPLSLPREPSRPVTPTMDEELAAPPLSSGSSQGDPEIWPPLQSLAKGRGKRPASGLRRTPVQNGDASDISSPPSLTYSPNYPEPSPPPARAARSRRRAAPKPETKVTTAALTGLLPRRRHKNAKGDPFTLEDDSDAEIDNTGLGDEDDELSYLDARSRRRPTSRAGTRNQNITRGRSTQRKGKKTPSSTRRAARTYGRSSDKENQDEGLDEDDTLEATPDKPSEEDSEDTGAPMGSELKDAARKFQEVDKWELDYEEMTQSSSPCGGR